MCTKKILLLTLAVAVRGLRLQRGLVEAHQLQRAHSDLFDFLVLFVLDQNETKVEIELFTHHPFRFADCYRGADVNISVLDYG